jgi:hypothetical protein
MKSFGYEEDNQGRTSGSRISFYNEKTGHILKLHKPHPQNILKGYQLELILEDLEGKKLI